MTGAASLASVSAALALRLAEAGHTSVFVEPPSPVSGGRDTLIYSFRTQGGGPQILRLFPSGSVGRARFEAAVQSAVATQGYPVPQVVLAGDDIAGLPFMVMERVPGEPLASWIVPPGPRMLRAPRMLAEAHVALHALDAGAVQAAVEGLDAGKPHRPAEMLARRLEQLDRPEDTSLRRAVEWARERAVGGDDVVCHGDFHPFNVLVDGDSLSGVIDWTDLQFAPREYDVARNMVLNDHVPMGGPLLGRPFMAAARRWLGRRYVTEYQRLHPLSSETLQCWAAVNAVLMLAQAVVQRRAGTTYIWQDARAAGALARRVHAVAGIDVLPSLGVLS